MVKYSDGEIGNVTEMEDFLPSPEMLRAQADEVEITLAVSPESFRFFEKEAQKYNLPIHTVMQQWLDRAPRS